MREFLTLPRQLQMRELIRFLSTIVNSSVTPFMAMYYVGYFGSFWTGLMIVAAQIVSFIATLYGGHIADVLGRKKAIMIGLGESTFGWLILVVGNVPGHIIPILTFFGVLLISFGGSYSYPAFDAMIIDMTDESNRRFVYTIGYWFMNIAIMLGAGLAGLFYDHYLFELLLACLLFDAFGLGVVSRFFHETKPQDLKTEHTGHVLSSFKNYAEVIQDKIFLIYTFGMIGSSFIFAQIDNSVPVHYRMHFITKTVFGVTITSSKMLSLSVLINTIMIIFLMTIVNNKTKKMPLIPQYVIGMTLNATGFLLMMTWQQLPPLVFAVVLATVGEMINVPASQVLRADMMNPSKIGSYSGFLSASYPIGSLLAGFMITLNAIIGQVGVRFVFAFVSALSIFLVAWSAKKHQQQIVE